MQRMLHDQVGAQSIAFSTEKRKRAGKVLS